MGTAVEQVVAVDGSDHHIAQVHLRGHVRHLPGFVRVQMKLLFRGRSFRDGAEAAAARAKIAQNHKGRGSAMEALVNIRAAGGFADSVETPLPEFGF